MSREAEVMAGLVAFIRARLGEDQADAERAGGGFDLRWIELGPGTAARDAADYWQRLGPARTLIDVTAKRAILNLCERALEAVLVPPLETSGRGAGLISIAHYDAACGEWDTLEPVLRHLGAVWNGHPNYRIEWVP